MKYKTVFIILFSIHLISCYDKKDSMTEEILVEPTLITDEELCIEYPKNTIEEKFLFFKYESVLYLRSIDFTGYKKGIGDTEKYFRIDYNLFNDSGLKPIQKQECYSIMNGMPNYIVTKKNSFSESKNGEFHITIETDISNLIYSACIFKDYKGQTKNFRKC